MESYAGSTGGLGGRGTAKLFIIVIIIYKIDILFLNVLKKSHKRRIKMHNFNDQLLLEITR